MAIYDELLAGLGNALGMDLAFDEDSCSLLIQDMYSVNIRKDEDRGVIVLSGIVAEETPEELSQPLMLDLLTYALAPMYDNGPVVGREPESDALIAYVVVPVKDTSPTDFVAITQKFLEFQMYVIERISNEDADMDATSSDTFIPTENVIPV